MRKLLSISTVILLVLRMQGQEVVRFDTVHINQVGSFAGGYSVFEVDSGYRVFGVQKGLAGLSQDIYVTDFNGTGGLQLERSFETYQQDWFGSSSPIVAHNGAYFAGLSRGLVVGVLDSLLLYKFGADGDTLWTRFVAVDTAYAMRGAARTASGDILLTGIHYPGWSDGGNEAFVYRLDSNGTEISHHGYADLDGEDVVGGMNGTWYVCGRGNSVANLDRAVLLRSDTNGAVMWRRTLPPYGRFVSMIPLKDGSVIGLGIAGPGGEPGFSLAVKYDTLGTQIWRRDLLQSDNSSRPSIFQAGFEAEDSSLVLCGWLSRADTQTKGTVVKLDENGEVLWSRFYAHFQVVGVLPWQMFWDVKPTSDGGLVLTGEANSEDYPHPQLWLLKLDSAGCLIPGCGSVGVEEYVDDLNKLLRVSPNPASDHVNLAMDLPHGASMEGEAEVLLLDATGKLVLQERVQQNFNQLRATLDVSALPTGTYYLHLRDDKRWLAGSKVVVE